MRAKASEVGYAGLQTDRVPERLGDARHPLGARRDRPPAHSTARRCVALVFGVSSISITSNMHISMLGRTSDYAEGGSRRGTGRAYGALLVGSGLWPVGIVPTGCCRNRFAWSQTTGQVSTRPFGRPEVPVAMGWPGTERSAAREGDGSLRPGAAALWSRVGPGQSAARSWMQVSGLSNIWCSGPCAERAGAALFATSSA